MLDQVDLSVPAGEITVLLGPSGAGKTVTISHIVGLMHPDRGRVEVEGHDLARDLRRGASTGCAREWRWCSRARCRSPAGCSSRLNVYENVAFALRQRNRWSEAQVHEATMANLEMVGLRDRADAMPDQLSAGMCKRVAIARALALEARLVIVDDFDSGIDGVRLSLLCEMLADAQRQSGATFLVTTHNMSAARHLADNLAVISDGRIVESGPAAEVLDSDRTARASADQWRDQRADHAARRLAATRAGGRSSRSPGRWA